MHSESLNQGANRHLATKIREKGWTMRDAADYLGVSRQRLYSVSANSNHARLWDCAVLGLPVCTQEIVNVLKERRNQKSQPLVATINGIHNLAVGDVVIADFSSEIADEGSEGCVTQIRGHTDSLEILVKIAERDEWFTIKDFCKFFITNGKTCLL